MVNTNVNPAWSLTSSRNFVVLKINLAATIVTSAFGYGSIGSQEQSHSLVFIETENAVVVPFIDKIN